MKRLIGIFRPLVAILLIFQVSAVYALPSSLEHINLCFGSDGHFDISTDLCADNSLALPLSPWDTAVFSNEDHIECLDIEIGHNSSDVLLPPITKISQSKAKTKSISSSPVTENFILSSSHLASQFSISNFSLMNSGSLPPSHLVSIRTTVLLV